MNQIKKTPVRFLLGGIAVATILLGAGSAFASAVVHEKPADTIVPAGSEDGTHLMQKVQKVQKVQKFSPTEMPAVTDDDWEHDADMLLPAIRVSPVDGAGR